MLSSVEFQSNFFLGAATPQVSSTKGATALSFAEVRNLLLPDLHPLLVSFLASPHGYKWHHKWMEGAQKEDTDLRKAERHRTSCKTSLLGKTKIHMWEVNEWKRESLTFYDYQRFWRALRQVKFSAISKAHSPFQDLPLGNSVIMFQIKRHEEPTTRWTVSNSYRATVACRSRSKGPGH